MYISDINRLEKNPVSNGVYILHKDLVFIWPLCFRLTFLIVPSKHFRLSVLCKLWLKPSFQRESSDLFLSDFTFQKVAA